MKPSAESAVDAIHNLMQKFGPRNPEPAREGSDNDNATQLITLIREEGRQEVLATMLKALQAHPAMNNLSPRAIVMLSALGCSSPSDIQGHAKDITLADFSESDMKIMMKIVEGVPPASQGFVKN